MTKTKSKKKKTQRKESGESVYSIKNSKRSFFLSLRLPDQKNNKVNLIQSFAKKFNIPI